MIAAVRGGRGQDAKAGFDVQWQKDLRNFPGAYPVRMIAVVTGGAPGPSADEGPKPSTGVRRTRPDVVRIDVSTEPSTAEQLPEVSGPLLGGRESVRSVPLVAGELGSVRGPVPGQ